MTNDIAIITGLITIFIIIGTVMPFINASFGSQVNEVDVDGMADSVGQGVELSGDVNAFQVFSSIMLMFFWTFGALPFWLDMIFIIFRVVLGMTVARNIWIGGGA